MSGSGIGLPTKPDKACTDRAIDALKVDRKDVLYVGDSYVDVLTAKIQALLRRTYDFGGQTGLLEHRGALLNTGDATLTYEGRKVELSKNEYRILQVLFERRGRVVARETLMQRLWETDLFVDENTLTVNIARLRRKLEAKGVRDLIVTKKGLGYMVE